MVNEIEVTLRGHVGHEPKLLSREGKQTFLRLNVASTPRIRSREGEWGDGTTQWFAVKLFGEFAEHVAHSVRKGDAVLVRGRLEHEEYVTREGEPRWTAVIVADAFGPDLRTSLAHVTRAVRRTSADTGSGAEPGEDANSQGGSETAAGATADGDEDRTRETAGAAEEATEVADGAQVEEGAVDVSGFTVLPDDGTEAEDSMAARMSA